MQGRPPETRYAKSGNVHIAYQVTGDGPIDLLMVPGFISHVEHVWDDPHWAAFLGRLGSFARLIRFDKRGTGLSDRVGDIPTLEERMDDVRAVMDAAGSQRAAPPSPLIRRCEQRRSPLMSTTTRRNPIRLARIGLRSSGQTRRPPSRVPLPASREAPRTWCVAPCIRR